MRLNPYFFGWLALAVMYVVSIAVTRSGWPWALARGHNNQLSASLLQFFVFTAVTVFAYVTVYAARVIALAPNEQLPSLPEVPVNLLILMGLSVATASSSKAITITYLQQNQLPTEDKSSLIANREGASDLTKVQMIIWTLIAAAIYIIRINRFIVTQEYAQGNIALPDIDGALLVLMGASQGGYVAGKLVSRAVATPVIEHLVPAKAKAAELVSILGNFFGDTKEGNSVILKDQAGHEHELPAQSIVEWTNTKIRFNVPAQLAPQANQPTIKYSVRVRANAQTSAGMELEITA